MQDAGLPILFVCVLIDDVHAQVHAIFNVVVLFGCLDAIEQSWVPYHHATGRDLEGPQPVGVCLDGVVLVCIGNHGDG